MIKLKSIRSQIYVVTVMALLLTTISISTANIFQFQSDYKEALADRSVTIAQNLRVTVYKNLQFFPLDGFSGMADYLQTMLRANEGISYVYVTDRTGQILYHNDASQVGRAVAADAYAEGDFSNPDFALNRATSSHYESIVPLIWTDKVIGYIHVGVERAILDAKISTMIWQTAIILIIVLIVTGYPLYKFMSGNIVVPLIALTETASKVAAGDLSQTVELEQENEIGTLATTFNDMTARLRETLEGLEERNQQLSQEIEIRRQAEDALRRLNEELDQRVEERTAELAQANVEIQILNERLKDENLRMSAELAVTQRLQEMLLPTPEELRRIEGLDIAGFMQPAEEVGGDYYDVLQHNGNVKFGIGDVTGHGLESGVVMLMAQTAVRALLTGEVVDNVRFMDVLNRTLYDNIRRMNVDKSLTLSLLDYTRDGRLTLCGQHEKLILVRQSGQVELVDTLNLGFPLGLETNITKFVDALELELAPGDGVVLYSDGITEAENARAEFYGLERLCAVVQRHWNASSEAIKEAVVGDVRAFIGGHKVYDDLTLLIFKVVAEPV